MPDDTKMLAKQVEKLSDRLDRIEASLHRGTETGGGGYGGRRDEDDASDNGSRVCALPPVPERQLAANVSIGRERLIRIIEKKWVNGTQLHYYFFTNGPWAGAQAQRDLVVKGFKVWADLDIGIEFVPVNDIAAAEIRIGFLQGDGAWSYVGRDVLEFPGQQERTMNFGWDLTHDPRREFVAVHEIGHTLGFPHEHQNPFSGIVWDEPAVYQRFAGPPNNWPQSTTFHNILRKLSASEVEGTAWDSDSIMHYDFPAGLVLQPEQYRTEGIHPHGGLSEHDIAQVKLFYPPIQNTSYPRLEPMRSQTLSIAAGQQRDFSIEPTESREYTIGTFGRSDTVMVLFEKTDDDDLKFVAGDDDSGTDLNARIVEWLEQGKSYVLRIRLYLNWASADTAVMLW
jgi:hypothetical protein